MRAEGPRGMSADEGPDADIVALLKAVLALLHEERDWLRCRIQSEMALLRVDIAHRRNQQASASFDLAAVQAELASMRAEFAAAPRAVIPRPQKQIEEDAA